MALWLWLEYTGYPNIISTIMQLSDSIVMSLSEEAIMCLDTLGALQNPIAPNGGGSGEILGGGEEGWTYYHKNLDVGNRVWKKLLDIGVTHCGTHVLTCNIYREAGYDAEVNRIRSRIQELGMKKKPDCSIIKVNNQVEEFLARIALIHKHKKFMWWKPKITHITLPFPVSYEHFLGNRRG
ncbi:hypothetical protein PIB30_051033 [Stylosanthes scabra]|uniref:Uncharacterized protein n=1 Tax=Stylosanthes scabra TaxID=79078 RepID=A0ABU6YGL0_9FABA|nr:hypothetical protein [Stylosanthes scabra]